MAEKRRILPFGNVAKTGALDVGWDSTRVALGVRVPFVHREFEAKLDFTEGALLAPRSPPFCDKGRGEEAGAWEVVDDFVDYLLGE